MFQVGSDIDGETAGDQFGRSVALSADGTRIAIGGQFNDGNGVESGHVRVYSESGGIWTQVGSDIDGEAAGDRSGRSVALSSDGTVLAIGAHENSGNGTSAGHVRVYSESGGVWTQVGSDIDGEAPSDEFGGAVALSSNGMNLISGAIYNDGNGVDAGHARVYIDETSLPVELISFTLKNTPEGVLCSWITESEIENIGFFLERRTDGEKWQEIASYKTENNLMGQGTTSFPTEYEHVDRFVIPNTTYEYRLADVDYNGIVTYHPSRKVRVDYKNTEVLGRFTLLPAYPNPFNPVTTIRYSIPPVILSDAQNPLVNISIYNINGKLISTLVNEVQSLGWHSVTWNGTDNKNNKVPAGVYICKVIYGNEERIDKMMLIK